MEATPKHLIIVDGAILQPIPEHPKRDFIFCLSTAFGDAYLFQVREHQMNYGTKIKFTFHQHLISFLFLVKRKWKHLIFYIF